jgi:4-hydroxy 2-oxovalerate aldolase
MGKSAGNANLELVASYKNRVHGGQYKIEQLLDCIYSDIMQIYQNTPWGYNLHYYISAVNDCHPSYTKFLLDKNTLSIQSINEVISAIPKQQRLTYSQNLVETLYVNHQTNIINDVVAIKKISNAIGGRKILVLFPGKSVLAYKAEVDAYIQSHNPIVISVNFLPSLFCVDYIFAGNGKRYDKLIDRYFDNENPPPVIATSNILESAVPITHQLNYESLISANFGVSDNGAILCLNMILRLGISNIAVAGMDGFSDNVNDNFADKFMEMYNSTDSLTHNNAVIMQYLETIQERLKLAFITPSIFDNTDRVD